MKRIKKNFFRKKETLVEHFMFFGTVAIFLLLFIGEIRCIYKATKCNWNPIDKAEIIYTGAALTGLGLIVGWIDIEDK